MASTLIYSPYAINTPHFETELELAQLHLDAGDHVYWLGCERGLGGCDVNWQCIDSVCARCTGRRDEGLGLLMKTELLTILPPITPISMPEFNALVFADHQALRKFSYDGWDVGFAVLSSLISITRDPLPDLHRHATWLRSAVQSAVHAYRRIRQAIEEENIDSVYVHNGRFAMLRAAVRAAEHARIDFFAIEVGADNHRYQLFPNALPHDMEFAREQTSRTWELADTTHREAIACSFYESRAAKQSHWWKNFGELMQDGLLPASWTPDALPVFVSSEDEFEAISETHRNQLYPGGQVEAIRCIAVDLARCNPGQQLFIRMHPNLTGITNAFTRGVEQLATEFDSLTLIAADSAVDSYAMIHAADRILSFGSTVGAEAVYWETPSIIATTACFFPKDVGYQATSHSQVIEWILQPSLAATPREPALAYGYYAQMRGTKFKYYESESIFRGKFRGVQLTGGFVDKAPGLRQRLGWGFDAVVQRLRAALK